MAQANEMTGGEAMARMLKALNAGPMFGMGGFQLLAFYDAARRLKLDHHLINDERCGAFAADAYAKVSGRVGLVDATLGPGATNLATGLVEALNAGSPVVAFIGDSNRLHAGKNMTQEARQTEILRPAAKELLRIEDASRIPELIRRAFQVATSGRPGPVVVAVPEDVCHGTLPFNEDEFAVDARWEQAPSLRCRPAADDIAPSGQAARCSQAADHAVRRRRAHLAGGRGREYLRACAGDPGGAHHDGQGRHCLHRSAERGPVRPLRPHRQRADRGCRCDPRGRLQAGRDRHQAVHHPEEGQDGHPSRHPAGGVRPHAISRRWRCGATCARAFATWERR